MEIQINKEIKDYKEQFAMGLTLRQSVFGVLALLSAVGAYFLGKDYFSMDVLTWIIVIAALPFGLIAFFEYEGLSAEQFLIVWIKSELLTPERLSFIGENRIEKQFDEIEKMKLKPIKIKIKSTKNSKKKNLR